MSSNNMGINGAFFIAKLIRKNRGIRILKVADNDFNEEGGRMLASGIEVCQYHTSCQYLVLYIVLLWLVFRQTVDSMIN